MAAMNRGLNLPAIQKIMNEFERESAMMDMKEGMMSEAIDDVMDDEAEDEEIEGDKILNEVLEEIGIDIQQKVSTTQEWFPFEDLTNFFFNFAWNRCRMHQLLSTLLCR